MFTQNNPYIMKLYKPDEPFIGNGKKEDMTIGDFWSFQFSNIYSDPDEIAEYIVAKALEITEPYNKEVWTVFDILYRNKRIEVKETAYYHPWEGKINKNRRFDIHKSANYGESELERQNDIYVFCILTGETKEDAFPLNLDN